RRDLVIAHFIQLTIVPKVTVSEEESRKFYDQNQDKFVGGETVRASHILVGVDAKATAEEKQKAREKAEKLRKELAAGADFATLARENSTCPSSKQGGDLGYFGKGQMVPPFEQAAFALKPGGLSDVVETQFGYHIIKLVEKKGPETVAFKDAQPRIGEYLKNQKAQEMFLRQRSGTSTADMSAAIIAASSASEGASVSQSMAGVLITWPAPCSTGAARRRARTARGSWHSSRSSGLAGGRRRSAC
ncbi:MAG: peptidylprolyl isomerase, partial [Gaiellaceae bacterium]